MSFFNSDGFGNQLASFGLNAVGGTAASIIGGALNQKYAKDSFNRQNDYNNWLIQNGPSMQVNALRNAGLNPALMNGSIPQLAGGAAAPGTTSAPSFGQSDYNPQSALIDSQTNLLNEQALKEHIQALNISDLTPAQKELLQSEAFKNTQEGKRIQTLTPFEARNLEQTLEKLQAETDYITDQDMQYLIEAPYQIQMLQLAVANSDADLRVKGSQMRNLAALTKKYNTEAAAADVERRKAAKELEELLPNLIKEARNKASKEGFEALSQKYFYHQLRDKSPSFRSNNAIALDWAKVLASCLNFSISNSTTTMLKPK